MTRLSRRWGGTRDESSRESAGEATTDQEYRESGDRIKISYFIGVHNYFQKSHLKVPPFFSCFSRFTEIKK